MAEFIYADSQRESKRESESKIENKRKKVYSCGTAFESYNAVKRQWRSQQV